MAETQPKPKQKTGWLNVLVDYGPVLVFFLSYRHFSPSDPNDPIGEMLAVVKSTAAFMVAAVAALIVSRWRLGRISPMLWLSTLLIVGFGGLTVLLRDPIWIQIKPTAIYLLFGITLIVGAWRGQAFLKYLLEAAFEGLDEDGWRKLSRNWAVFFVFLAALNEVLNLKSNGAFRIDMNTWIAAKIWLFVPLSFLFTFTQLPMLLRHGLLQEAEGEVLADPPHE